LSSGASAILLQLKKAFVSPSPPKASNEAGALRPQPLEAFEGEGKTPALPWNGRSTFLSTITRDRSIRTQLENQSTSVTRSVVNPTSDDKLFAGEGIYEEFLSPKY